MKGTEGGTRREEGDPDPASQAQTGTRREAPPSGPQPPDSDTGTRREAQPQSQGTEGDEHGHSSLERESHGVGPGEVGYGETVLFPSLRSRYQFLSEPRAGNEAQVVRALDTTTDQSVLIKQYSKGIAPDVEALRLISELNNRHVVSLLDFGTDPGSGRFYEIQCWIDGDDLQHVLDNDDLAGQVAAVASQLASGLGAYHGAGLIHRDLKPGNVIVAKRDPLRLVAVDFGLARTLQGTKRMTSVAGTIEYRAPEAIHSSGLKVPNRAALDWWSMGIILAEVWLGHSFFALPDGSSRPEAEIEAVVRDRRLNWAQLDGNPALQHLCRGLLTYDVDHRWAREEVEKWLADPNDRSLTVVTENAASVRRRSVHFHGEHTGPESLAAQFQEQWDEAARRLFSDPSARLRRELLAMAEEYRLAGVVELLESTSVVPSFTASGPATRSASDLAGQRSASSLLAELLALLDPTLAPRYKGIDLRPQALPALASPDRIELQNELFDEEILLVWRQLPDMGAASQIHDRWGRLRDEIESTGRLSSVANDDAIREAKALALALAVDDAEGRAALLARLGTKDVKRARKNPEWKRMARRSSSSAELALAVASGAEVVRQLATQTGTTDRPSPGRGTTNNRTSTGRSTSTPRPSSRLRAPVITAVASVALALYLRAEGYLDIEGLIDAGPLLPALLVGAVGLIMAALGRRVPGQFWIWLAVAGGAALINRPLAYDSLFVDGVSVDRFAMSVLLLPPLALMVQLIVTYRSSNYWRAAALVVASLLIAVAFGSPWRRVLDALEPEQATPASPPPVTEAQVEQVEDVASPVAGGADGPCWLAQLATVTTEEEAQLLAADYDELSEAGRTIVGPSHWLPDWATDRFVVFQRFESSSSATAFLEDLGSQAGDGVVVDLEAGADGCG